MPEILAIDTITNVTLHSTCHKNCTEKRSYWRSLVFHFGFSNCGPSFGHVIKSFSFCPKCQQIIAQSFCFWLCCMLMTQISCIQCIKFLRIDFLVKLFGGGDFLKDRGGHNIVKGKAPWSSIRICICIFFICNAVAYPRMWLSGLALLGGGLGPLLAHVASVRGPPLFPA